MIKNILIILCLVFCGCHSEIPLYGSEIDIIEPNDVSSAEEIEDVTITPDVVEEVAIITYDVSDANDPLRDVYVGTTPTFFGCTDAVACNYDPKAEVDNQSCIYAEENQDCSGNCLAEVDCFGVCDGIAELDDCGVCDGTGPEYCLSGAMLIGCEEIDVYIKLENFLQNSTGFWGVDVMVSYRKDIWAYQFDIDTNDIVAFENGLTEEYDFFGINSSYRIVALALDLNPILATEDSSFMILTKIYGQGSGCDAACISDPMFIAGPNSDPELSALSLKVGVCNPCSGL